MNLATLELETPRLLLRPTLPQDFEPFAAFQADAESMRYLGSVPQPRSLAWRSFLTMAGAWAMQGFAMFSVIEKAVGWGIARDRCRLGYATEAATAAIDWAFTRLGWTEVIHVIDPANVASQGVARKLGSRNRGRGQLPAPFADSVIDVWGQTKTEWVTRHSQR